ncbi:MAG: hypothetical protein QM757_18170, partial [Paludibaculum sp.]
MSDTGEFEAESSDYELDSEFEFEAYTGTNGGAELGAVRILSCFPINL